MKPKAMKYSLLVLFSICLVACVPPPSRSYDSLTANAVLMQSEALNIDRITPSSFTVSARKTWQNTGQFVNNGDVINITAHGSWSPAPQLLLWSGPEGNAAWGVEVPGIPGSALIAKIGHDGKPFGVGTTQTFRSQDYGMLYLAMNDSFSYLYDNSGEVVADIYIDGNGESGPVKKVEIVSYDYDDASRSGSLSARVGDDHFATRQHMIIKIGEIASSKNIAIQAGKEKNNGGNYELRDEFTRDGILTINFKALW